MHKKHYKKRAWLQEQIIISKKPIKQISKEVNVSSITIRRWAKKHNIDFTAVGKERLYRDKIWLKNEYEILKKSSVKIAEESNISFNTVFYWLKKYKIRIRSDFSGKNNPFFGKRHSKIVKDKLARLRHGSKHTDESKKKMSLAHKGKLLGIENPAKRPEVRKKISESQKKRYQKNPKLREEISVRAKKRLFEKKNHPNFGKRGKESAAWKEPSKRKTHVSKRLRTCKEYIAWRSACFVRDQFKCQICKIDKTYFEVDHYKKPFCLIIAENEITQENLEEKIISCEELWDLKNGRTLCLSCHKKTDTYGIKARQNKVKKT